MGLISNGTTLLDAGALDSGVATGAMTLLSAVTASSSATIEFTSGINSTYKEYQFHYTDMHPQTNNQSLLVLFRDGSSAFDATVTSSAFEGYNNEADTAAALAYNTGFDVAQGTGGQELLEQQGSDNDQCAAGILQLFDPSSTTFVKQFISRSRNTHHADYSIDGFVAGYCNVTAAIDGVQFKFASGNIDSGTIKMYGIK